MDFEYYGPNYKELAPYLSEIKSTLRKMTNVNGTLDPKRAKFHWLAGGGLEDVASCTLLGVSAKSKFRIIFKKVGDRFVIVGIDNHTYRIASLESIQNLNIKESDIKKESLNEESVLEEAKDRTNTTDSSPNILNIKASKSVAKVLADGTVINLDDLQGEVRKFLDDEALFSREAALDIAESAAVEEATEATEVPKSAAAEDTDIPQRSIIRIIAPGGAGKTLAALAAFEKALDVIKAAKANEGGLPATEKIPSLVYLAPTQELCTQMQLDVQSLMSKMNIDASQVNIQCLTYDQYNAISVNNPGVSADNISALLIKQFNQYINANKIRSQDISKLRGDLTEAEFYSECSNLLVWPDIERVGRNTLITAESDKERKEKLGKIKEFAAAYGSYIQASSNDESVLKDPSFVTLPLAVKDSMLVVCDESQTQSAHAIRGIAKQPTVVMVLSDPNQVLEARLAFSPFYTIGLKGEQLLECNNTNRCSASAASLASAIINIRNKEFGLRNRPPITVESAVKGVIYKSKSGDYKQYYNHHDVDTYLIVFDKKIREDLKKNGALLVFSPKEAIGLERKKIVIITTQAKLTTIVDFNRLYVAVTRSQEDVIIVDNNYDEFGDIFTAYGESNLAEFDASSSTPTDLSTYSALKSVIDLFAQSKNTQAEEILNFLYNRVATEQGGKTKQALQEAKAKLAAITRIIQGKHTPEEKLQEILLTYDRDFSDSEFAEFYSDCLESGKKEIVIDLSVLTEDTANQRSKDLAQKFMIDEYFNGGRFSFDEITPILSQLDYAQHKKLLSELQAKIADDGQDKARLSQYKKYLLQKFKDLIFDDLAAELRPSESKLASSPSKGKKQTAKPEAQPAGVPADSKNLTLLLDIALEDQEFVIKSIFAELNKKLRPVFAKKLFPLMFTTIYQNFEKYKADQLALIKESISDDGDQFLIAYKAGRVASILDNFLVLSLEQKSKVSRILGENNIYEDYAKFNASKAKNNKIADYITHLLMTNGNPEFAKILLDGNVPLTSSDFKELEGLKGKSLIQAIFSFVAEKSYIEIVDVLLTTTNKSVKVNVNFVNKDGNTVLMFAVEINNLALVEHLLKVPGIEINEQNKQGYTALMLAVFLRHDEITRALLERSDINIKDIKGNTVLMAATETGDVKTTKALLAHPDIKINDKNIQGVTALRLVVERDNVEIAKALLAHSDLDVNAKTEYNYTALTLTVRKGYVELAKALLERSDLDVNAKTEEGYTALLIAAYNNKIEVAEALLERSDIEVNIKNVNGNTALMLAVKQGHVEVLELLLAHRKIEVNEKNNQGNTALMLAVKQGHVEVLERLLKVPGIEVNEKNNQGYTALMLAAEKDDVKMAKALLAHSKIEVNAENLNRDTALMLVAEKGHFAVAERLLVHPKIEVNEKNKQEFTALMVAAEKGHWKVAERLLAHRKIEVNEKNKQEFTALMVAAEKGHWKVAELLLKVPAIEVNDPNNQGNSALMVAAYFGHVEVVERLLAHPDIDVNIKNKHEFTALMVAAEKGHWKVAELLLKVQAIEVNDVNNQGYTALMVVAYFGHVEVVERLLAHPDIDVNIKNNKGYTALMLAAICGHIEVVKVLLARSDIEVNVANFQGIVALMFAVKHGHVEIVECLLKVPGIEVNIKNNDGNTALMVVAETGNVEIAKALLAHSKIDVNTQNVNGNTALMLAENQGFEDIGSVLREYQKKNVTPAAVVQSSQKATVANQSSNHFAARVTAARVSADKGSRGI